MAEDERKVSGRARGGAAVAAKMTEEQRKERARRGSAARWGLRTTHTGNFKEAFGIDVDCYVLNDPGKTAVISQRGMAIALAMGDGGSRLPRFVSSKGVSPYIGPELREKLEKPIVFQQVGLGHKAGGAPSANGYDASVLIDLCQAIIRAANDGALHPSQSGVAKQASVIVTASAKAGIQGLVYALAGYDRTREEIIEAYKMYVRNEAREYEREFSPELYEQWHRLYGLAKLERGRPWEFRYLTIDHIYKPLANSHGKVFDLAKSNKAENGERSDKIHQFLSEVGVKALRTQVGKIMGIASVSENREQYEKFISEKVYGQKTLPF